MKILVLNTGSSSLKYTLSEAQIGEYLADGLIESIGSEESRITQLTGGGELSAQVKAPDHRRAFELMIEYLTNDENGIISDLAEIDAVGHRVVHGGNRFYDSVEIDEDVMEAILEFEDLAPLHNPINILGIRIAKELLPDVPHVAVFDTAFHQTIPETAYLYALPMELSNNYKIRRYGFHGTSHSYVSQRAARLIGTPIEELKIITCHLGNGCSMAAIDGGRSVDTTMGFTPLEGLVMGTRSGDIDPSIIFYLVSEKGYGIDDVEDILNKRSGVLGLSGITNDVKTLLEAAHGGNARAALALDVFAYRVKKYIGAYMAALGGVDCLVFTAGIGERSSEMREKICSNLEGMGIALDKVKNDRCFACEMVISPEELPIKVVVIPTDEEYVIAAETNRIATERMSS